MPLSHANISTPKTAILGVGLIGGSIGRCLRAAGAEVAGWDRNQLSVSRALELGAISSAAVSVTETLRHASLVVIATPIDSIIPLVTEIAVHLSEGAVVTDVGASKTRIVREAEALLGGRFVGGHPMAGSEESGVEASSADLFTGAAWVLTPTERTDSAALETVRQMVAMCGARARECDPDTHDSLIAALSHLPHLAAFGLAETVGIRVDDDWTDLAAGSFRDGTRVSLSDPFRWARILADNRAAVEEALDGFTAWIEQARAALNSGDSDALAAMLSEAHSQRKRFQI